MKDGDGKLPQISQKTQISFSHTDRTDLTDFRLYGDGDLNTNHTNHTKQRSADEVKANHTNSSPVRASLLANTEGTEYTESSFLNTNNTNNTNKGDSPSVKSVESVGDYIFQRELKWLGLWKFARAVMWVLHEALGLPEAAMIAPMDEKRGRLLLNEILDGGNFGRHAEKYGRFTQQGMAKKYFLKIWRNMHFVRYYPAEALSEPVFRTWHFFWRGAQRLKY